MSDLSNQNILVTAAAAGIGRATAIRLLAGGARVTATDLDQAGLNALLAEADAGDRLSIAAMDATDQGQIAAVIAQQDDWTGLYNGVGWVAEGALDATSLQDWNRAWQINVTSMFMVTQAILPCFQRHGKGAVLNVSSIASSLKGLPNRCAYGTTKAAVLGFTKSVAADYVGQGIRVNAICPGTVETPSLHGRINAAPDPAAALQNFIARQPIGRLGQPEEIAEIAAFLLSDSAAYVTGSIFTLDGGISI